MMLKALSFRNAASCEVCRHFPKDRVEERAVILITCMSEFDYLIMQCEKQKAGGYPAGDVHTLPVRKRATAPIPRTSTTTTSGTTIRSQRSKVLLKELPSDPDFRHPGSATDSNVIPQRILDSGVMIKFQNLDAALKEALVRGWPDWETTGAGGDFPPKEVHDFSYMKLKFGARIDCFRGESSYDFRNLHLDEHQG